MLGSVYRPLSNIILIKFIYTSLFTHCTHVISVIIKASTRVNHGYQLYKQRRGWDLRYHLEIHRRINRQNYEFGF